MQSLTVAPTWHSHKAYQTSGHVWQGRFKSPTIQNDAPALVVLRYIEANPLRVGLVSNLSLADILDSDITIFVKSVFAL